MVFSVPVRETRYPNHANLPLSDEYLSLINRLNDLTDAMAMSQSEPPEVLAQKTLLGLGFKDEDFGRKTETFSQGWNMRIELAKILL